MFKDAITAAAALAEPLASPSLDAVAPGPTLDSLSASLRPNLILPLAECLDRSSAGSERTFLRPTSEGGRANAATSRLLPSAASFAAASDALTLGALVGPAPEPEPGFPNRDPGLNPLGPPPGLTLLPLRPEAIPLPIPTKTRPISPLTSSEMDGPRPRASRLDCAETP